MTTAQVHRSRLKSRKKTVTMFAEISALGAEEFPMKTPTMFLAVVYFALAAAVLSPDSASRAAEKPTSTGKTFVYVSNFGSDAISAFQIDTSIGALLAVKGSPFKAGHRPEFLVSDDGQYLYISNVGSNSISAFAINGRTGALTPVPGSPFPVGRQPKGIAVVRSANLLFVVNVRDNNVSSLKIDAATGYSTPGAGIS